jgi:RimJ/RimL family protein N-acetyltransferase
VRQGSIKHDSGRILDTKGASLSFGEIETPRLSLRGLTAEDWPSVYGYMSDPRVTAWLPEGLLDEQASRAFALKNSRDGGEAVAVILKSSGRMIGHMVFHPWHAPRTHEIGWVFGQESQGRGYATEAARALLAYAFGPLRAHRVIATCQPQNPASWRVMEKLGMRREAHFRACIFRDEGIWWDEYFYALLAEEYERMQAR